MNIKLPASRLSCAIKKMCFKNISVTHECIDKDTHEDTMTKEVATPTVTCIYALVLNVR